MIRSIFSGRVPEPERATRASKRVLTCQGESQNRFNDPERSGKPYLVVQREHHAETSSAESREARRRVKWVVCEGGGVRKTDDLRVIADLGALKEA
jgi:hypothetical protein